MMKILSFLSTLASVIYLFVGFNTYRLNKKTREGILFLLLNITLSIWSFNYSFAYVTEDIYEFSFWNKLSSVGWSFFPVLVLLLVLTITNNKILESIIKYVIPLPGLLFWLISLFLFRPGYSTPVAISSFFYIGNAVYSYSYIFLSLAIIFLWGRSSEKVNQRKQARIILVSGIVPLLFDILFQVVFPFITGRYLPNFTQILILIMLWGIYYAIVNYNFMLVSNSLIINELFHEILDLAFLIDLDGKIIRTNKQVLNLLGIEWMDLVNTKITDVIEEKLDKLISDCENLKETVKYNRVTIYTKEEQPILLNISVSPIRESRNQILLGLLIVGQDIRLIEELRYEISSHKKTAEKLRKSEELFRTVAETIPFSIIMTNRGDNTILYINNKTEDLFQINHDEMIGELAFQFYVDAQDRWDLIKDLSEGKPVKEKEVIFKRKNDTVFSGLITMVTTVYNEKEVLLSCLADITEQKIMQQNIIKSEEMLRKLMDSIPDLVLVCDIEGNLTYVNKSIKSILGYDPEVEMPASVLSLLDKEELETARNNMHRLIKEDIGPIEYRCIKKDGSYINVEVNSNVLREISSEPFGYVFVTRDITERKKVQEALKQSKEEIERANNELIKSNYLLQEQSIRDSLTNLYNHRFIMGLLGQEIRKSIQSNSSLCLMMLDIDYFKRVNDNYGHQTGDRVLSAVSKLIQLNIRDNDYAGRYGGEEFIIILPDIQLIEAYDIAENVRKSIQNFSFTKKNLNVTISIGLTEYHSEDVKAFVNRADTLLYRAKENGRNRTESS